MLPSLTAEPAVIRTMPPQICQHVIAVHLIRCLLPRTLIVVSSISAVGMRRMHMRHTILDILAPGVQMYLCNNVAIAALFVPIAYWSITRAQVYKEHTMIHGVGWDI